MKTRSNSLGMETVKLDPQSPPQTGGRRTSLGFLPKFLRRIANKSPTQTQADTVDAETIEEVLNFEQNLEKGFLSEASLQLLGREKRLYGHTEQGKNPLLTTAKEEESQLLRDRDALLELVEDTIKKSLVAAETNAEALSSAVKAVCQEENQDKCWEQESLSQPHWRPSRWGKRHDSVLREVVTERLRNVQRFSPERKDEENKDTELSSIQRDVCGMGRLIKVDLLRVVREVKICYPLEMDICNQYAKMYHQAFSSNLHDVAGFGLGEKDSAFLLRWVNDYYPNMLQTDELALEINQESLGSLLTKELILPLEKQYISDAEVEVKTRINKILQNEKDEWVNGETPKLLDGCYCSPLAIDTLQCINGAVESTKKHLSDPEEALRMVSLLKDFLLSYKKFQEDVTQGSSGNTRTVIMANLVCVEQFRDSIATRTNLFSGDLKTSCLSLVAEMKTSGYQFLLSAAHRDMKNTYRNIGTPDWLKDKSLFTKLLDQIKQHIEELRCLSPSCYRDLMGQFHLEVMVEYMSKLLRVKIKLKDQTKQLEAAAIISQNVKDLHRLFNGEGSIEDWLKTLMLQIAEVIQLQDIPSLQLAIASLGNDYPDLSISHASALLKLKTNLSKSDRRKVKTILENRTESNNENARAFFSQVHLS